MLSKNNLIGEILFRKIQALFKIIRYVKDNDTITNLTDYSEVNISSINFDKFNNKIGILTKILIFRVKYKRIINITDIRPRHFDDDNALASKSLIIYSKIHTFC